MIDYIIEMREKDFAFVFSLNGKNINQIKFSMKQKKGFNITL